DMLIDNLEPVPHVRLFKVVAVNRDVSPTKNGGLWEWGPCGERLIAIKCNGGQRRRPWHFACVGGRGRPRGSYRCRNSLHKSLPPGRAVRYRTQELEASGDALGAPLISAPEVLEPVRRQLGVPHRVLDILVSEISLQGASVVPPVRQGEATGVPQ